MSYLEKVPERALLRDIKRYRDGPCPFKVELITNDEMVHDELAIRITVDDTTFYVLYAYKKVINQMKAFIDMIETGPEGVYVWKPLAFRVLAPFNPSHGYKPDKRGKWVEIGESRDGVKPIFTVPWCYELREALERALTNSDEIQRARRAARKR